MFNVFTREIWEVVNSITIVNCLTNLKSILKWPNGGLFAFNQLTQLFLLQTVKTYEDMTLEELEENEDEFGEEDEAAIEMYR